MNPQTRLTQCQQQFASVEKTECGLRLEILRLDRESNDLVESFNQVGDVIPALTELGGILSERAVVLTQYSEIATQLAALCRQSADAINQMAR